jgi:hypothetical protein
MEVDEEDVFLYWENINIRLCTGGEKNTNMTMFCSGGGRPGIVHCVVDWWRSKNMSMCSGGETTLHDIVSWKNTNITLCNGGGRRRA